MKKSVSFAAAALIMAFVMSLAMFTVVAHADETDATSTESTETSSDDDSSQTGAKAVAAGLAIGLAAGAGAIGMGIAVAKSNEGISRQPEASGSIRTSLMLGLVFIETAVIYALIVTILIIFVM